MQHNTWQGSLYSVSLTAPKLITACRWRTNGQWERPHSFLTKGDLQKSLSKSVVAFSSFIREHLDPIVKADQCAQCVDDIGMATKNTTDITRFIRAVFKCIRQAGLKLIIPECHFGVRQVEFLGRTISPEGNSPQARNLKIS